MTERTVTVQTEEEQTITLCDQCSLSDDAGEIIPYQAKRGSDYIEGYETMHLHRSCLEDLGVDVPDAPTFAQISKDGSPIDEPPILAFGQMEITLTALGAVITTVFGLEWYSANHIGLTMLMGAFAIVGVLLLCIGFGTARMKVTETIDEMKNND